MKISKFIQNISEVTMSASDKQKSINVSEVFHLWSHLTQRYHVINVTNILDNFAHDPDLKLILETGKLTLNKHVSVLEKEMFEYGIPVPVRPAKEVNTMNNVEQITDRYIYRRVLRGIQSFLPTHTMAFVHSTSPKIRELFMTFLIDEMKLYDKFLEYGKIKGYEVMPPLYRV